MGCSFSYWTSFYSSLLSYMLSTLLSNHLCHSKRYQYRFQCSNFLNRLLPRKNYQFRPMRHCPHLHLCPRSMHLPSLDALFYVWWSIRIVVVNLVLSRLCYYDGECVPAVSDVNSGMQYPFLTLEQHVNRMYSLFQHCKTWQKVWKML